MAADFDGTDDVIDIGESTVMNGLADASWFMWVDQDITPVGANLALYGEVGPTIPTTSWGLIGSDGVFTGRTDQYSTLVTDGSASIILVEGATGSLNTTDWQSVGSTFDGGSATGLRLYIDGSEDANSPVSVAGVSTLPTVTGGVTIGELHDGTLDNDFAAAWATQWDAILSATKMAALNRGANPFIMDNQNVIACYPMWNTDNLGMDISGNANNGTVTGPTQATRGAPVEPLENFL